MNKTYQIDAGQLGLEDIGYILAKGSRLALAAESRRAIQHCSDYLERKLRESDELFYGINTGFGSLCNIHISKEQTQALQHKLVQSHACGMGELVPQEIVRLMLLLKIKSLSYGYSGVRLELVEQLTLFSTKTCCPSFTSKAHWALRAIWRRWRTSACRSSGWAKCISGGGSSLAGKPWPPWSWHRSSCAPRKGWPC
jgi:histidine ammonia-lyase